MTVKELQEMIRIREQSDNPTEQSLMYLISQKLDELEAENRELKTKLSKN